MLCLTSPLEWEVLDDTDSTDHSSTVPHDGVTLDVYQQVLSPWLRTCLKLVLSVGFLL